MSDDKAMKSDLLPKFDAKEEAYNIWLLQIVAWLEAKNLGECTNWKNPDPNLPVEDGKWSADDETKEKEMKAVSKQKKGVALMTVALHDTLLDLVRNCKTKEYPHGLCYKIFEHLDAIYNINDETGRQHAKEELRKIKFKENDNPELFFIKILGVYNKYIDNGHLNERDLLDKVMLTAPNIYEESIYRLQEKGNATLQDYRREFLTRYRIKMLKPEAMKKMKELASSDDESDDGKEKALFANGSNDNDIVCYKCKKTGHRAQDCTMNDWKRKQAQKNYKNKMKEYRFHRQKKGSMKCYQCGTVGHKASECTKRNSGGKGSEYANVKVTKEVQLGAVNANDDEALRVNEGSGELTTETDDCEFESWKEDYGWTSDEASNDSKSKDGSIDEYTLESLRTCSIHAPCAHKKNKYNEMMEELVTQQKNKIYHYFKPIEKVDKDKVEENESIDERKPSAVVNVDDEIVADDDDEVQIVARKNYPVQSYERNTVEVPVNDFESNDSVSSMPKLLKRTFSEYSSSDDSTWNGEIANIHINNGSVYNHHGTASSKRAERKNNNKKITNKGGRYPVPHNDRYGGYEAFSGRYNDAEYYGQYGPPEAYRRLNAVWQDRCDRMMQAYDHVARCLANANSEIYKLGAEKEQEKESHGYMLESACSIYDSKLTARDNKLRVAHMDIEDLNKENEALRYSIEVKDSLIESMRKELYEKEIELKNRDEAASNDKDIDNDEELAAFVNQVVAVTEREVEEREELVIADEGADDRARAAELNYEELNNTAINDELELSDGELSLMSWRFDEDEKEVLIEGGNLVNVFSDENEVMLNWVGGDDEDENDKVKSVEAVAVAENRDIMDAFERVESEVGTLLINPQDMPIVTAAMRLHERGMQVFDEYSVGSNMDTAYTTQPSTSTEDNEPYVEEEDKFDDWSTGIEDFFNNTYQYCRKHKKLYGHELGSSCEVCNVCTDGMNEAWRDSQDDYGDDDEERV